MATASGSVIRFTDMDGEDRFSAPYTSSTGAATDVAAVLASFKTGTAVAIKTGDGNVYQVNPNKAPVALACTTITPS